MNERDKIHKRFRRRKCWICMIARKENHTLKAWARARRLGEQEPT